MTELLNKSSRRFDAAFREALRDLVLWRRDVRRFRRDPVDPGHHNPVSLRLHERSTGL